MSVSSLAEWKKLPEVGCPVIKGETSKGSAYTVYKVGFLALSPADCGDFDTSGAVFEVGKYFFPTAEVEFDSKKQLCRLPMQLSNWVIDSVALAKQMGKSPFPRQIEFGILGGRHYAEAL